MRKFISIVGMSLWLIGLIDGIVFLPLVLWGTTRHVYEADSAKGIQDSINASSAYDTVFVHTGTYFVRDVDSFGITMRDSIILMSPDPDSVTLSGLNAAGNDTAYHVIYCNFGNPSSHTAQIKGFTITNGDADGSAPHNCGGGIFCDSASPAIDSCVIVNNSANQYGGGLCIRVNSSPTITGNTITANSATVGGGGLRIYYYSAPTITGNMITNNSANYGGGIYIYYYSAPTISNNTIQNNSAGWDGGGFYINWHSPPMITKNTIVSNIAKRGGAICNVGNDSTVVIDSCFIVDNGSITTSLISGLAFIGSGAGTLKISHSHLYYNTFQPDTEIDNSNTSITMPLTYNFWWDTTDAEISNLIKGPNDHTPYETSFITAVPGEPTGVDSVRNYSDDSYSTVCDSIGENDTLYLRVYGTDKTTGLREAAVVLLKSSIYPAGIAVALMEADANSGVYQGEAYPIERSNANFIRIDDIYQRIGVNSTGDTIWILANVDTTKKFAVGYKASPPAGIKEIVAKPDKIFFAVSPNPVRNKLHIQYTIPESSKITIRLYDIVGRVAKTIVDKYQQPGNYEIKRDVKGLPSGIYFIKFSAGDCEQTRKLILIR